MENDVKEEEPQAGVDGRKRVFVVVGVVLVCVAMIVAIVFASMDKGGKKVVAGPTVSIDAGGEGGGEAGGVIHGGQSRKGGGAWVRHYQPKNVKVDMTKKSMYSTQRVDVYGKDDSWVEKGVDAAAKLDRDVRFGAASQIGGCVKEWMKAYSWESDADRGKRVGGCFVDWDKYKEYFVFVDFPRITSADSVYRVWQVAELSTSEMYSYTPSFEGGRPAAIFDVVVGRANMEISPTDKNTSLSQTGAMQVLVRGEEVDGVWKIAELWVPSLK